MKSRIYVFTHLFFRAAALVAIAATSSCTQRDPTWRTYREVSEFASEEPPSMAEAPAMAPQASGARSFTWTKPEGWTEEAGSGMRLASFTMDSGNETGLCTIVSLGGAAGGIEANVKRWMGQLNVEIPPDAEFAAFVEKQTPFESAGGFQGTMVDLTEFTADASSMLATALAASNSTMFIKLTGPKSLLLAQKPAFLELCKSIRAP